MSHSCTCPKCGQDISESWQDLDPDVGIFHAGWFCEECNEIVDHDPPEDYL